MTVMGAWLMMGAWLKPRTYTQIDWMGV